MKIKSCQKSTSDFTGLFVISGGFGLARLPARFSVRVFFPDGHKTGCSSF
jgi:hypothetical protein